MQSFSSESLEFHKIALSMSYFACKERKKVGKKEKDTNKSFYFAIPCISFPSFAFLFVKFEVLNLLQGYWEKKLLGQSSESRVPNMFFNSSK